MARSVNGKPTASPQGTHGPTSHSIPSTDTLAQRLPVGHHPHMRRSRQLKPLSSEHHHALLVAFQLKQALAGHAESAGAPRDLAGLAGLVRRFAIQVLSTHTQTEEDVLGAYLTPDDFQRLRTEHLQMARLVEATSGPNPTEQRLALAALADLLERHVRWEEREVFPYAEGHVDASTLADIGGELERRLVLARSETRNRGTPRPS
jgi:hemerythrin-like domain-containing protein